MKQRIGKVTIFERHGNYRLRFTFPKGRRHDITVAAANEEGWVIAQRAAAIVDRDINLGDIDTTYIRYSPRYTKVHSEREPPDLLRLWEQYKELTAGRVSKTTQKNCWRTTDNCLGKVDNKYYSLDKAEQLLYELSRDYSPETLRRVFVDINAAVNLGIRQGQIEKNPYSLLTLPKRVKKLIECFEDWEIKNIIAAFSDDRYCSKYSTYLHSYYADYVEFLALTGCRPGEAIALTWDDLFINRGRLYIDFNKSFSHGVLKSTKNHENRHLCCNPQLDELFKRTPQRGPLIFPSVTGGYINHRTWNRRYWIPVVKGLVGDKLVRKYLKPYCLRHSFITRVVRTGVDLATVAQVAGTSPEMIMRNYLASRDDYDIPEV